MRHTLYEPIWGIQVLHFLNNVVLSNNILLHSVGILADIFVFTYPIVLVYRFVEGRLKNNKNQINSIKISLSTAMIAIVNIIIQFFFFKQRPIFSAGEHLKTILKELPTASFPSDHAAVSMMMGVSTYYYGKKSGNKLMKNIGFFWIASSIIMGIARVATGVHRPTDVIAGWLIAIMVYYFIQDNKLISAISDLCVCFRNKFVIVTKLVQLKD